MPYSREHKAAVRRRIVECARVVFNRVGFAEATIEQIMAEAGLTRGGFYNHFRTKEELYAEAVASFLGGRGAEWRDAAGVKPDGGGPATVRAMIDSYLSDAHLSELEGQCPMIALPSDVARAAPQVRASYEQLLRAMTGLFEKNLPDDTRDPARMSLVLASLCVGGMILSRTIDDEDLAADIRMAARDFALTASQA
ncbi:MAG: TetR/AcrR family transcriptional regulator [Pseudomonadota bacterium]